MNLESHARARKLLSIDRVEGISAEERRWLDAHLATCEQCSNEATALAVAVDSLRSVRVHADENVVRRVRFAVHQRAEKLHRQRARTVPLWIAVVTSSTLAILTTPYIWSTFAWFGRALHVSSIVWQLGFLVWWFVPATVLSAAAALRRRTVHVADTATEANREWL